MKEKKRGGGGRW